LLLPQGKVVDNPKGVQCVSAGHLFSFPAATLLFDLIPTRSFSFEVARFQAQRADKSNAGGVTGC
jgi:hypothetical protein